MWVYYLLEVRKWALRRLEMITLPTWTGRSHFEYEGTVKRGTQIWFGKKVRPVAVSVLQYAELLDHFKGQEVPVGTSRDRPQSGSLGEWLQGNVTRTAIASYVAPILVKEAYAHRVTDPTKIKFS
jgi:hypothetical protein